MDIEALKTELALPAYTEAIKAGDDQTIADLLNAPGAGTISRGVISKDLFILALQGGLAGLLARPDTDPVKQSLSGWLKLLDMVTQIPTQDPQLLATLSAAVHAGVFQQAEVDAATVRPCSRAEQLDGAGAVASAADVAAALHDQRKVVYQAAESARRVKADELMAADPDLPDREALERADQILYGHDWGHK